MPLPEPYINKIRLKNYTQLLVERLAQVVFTNTSNVTDYESQYAGNPLVSATTLLEDIEENTEYILPFSYVVGTNQLHITVSGYALYKGIDYEEIGNEGEQSNTILLKISIEEGSVFGVVIFPNQVSFGRNIIVSNGNIVVGDDNSDNIKIVSQNPYNALSYDNGAFIHFDKIVPDTSNLDTSKEYVLKYKNGTVQWIEEN